MNCKIQTLCVKSNVSVNFTPPEVMDEDCVKILYYHQQNFTMCQRVVEIRTNVGNNDSSKQMEPDFSEVFTEEMYLQLLKSHSLVYRYDYSHCMYEIGIYSRLSVLQKFERFFEKIPHNSSVAFVRQSSANWFSLFVKALLIQLKRKAPIDAKYDQDIVQTWLSNNEPGRDIIAHLSALNNTKAKFIIHFSYYYEQVSAAQHATSQYTNIYLPYPKPEQLEAMTFLSSEKNKQSGEAYSMHMDNMEKYFRRTDISRNIK